MKNIFSNRFNDACIAPYGAIIRIIISALPAFSPYRAVMFGTETFYQPWFDDLF